MMNELVQLALNKIKGKTDEELKQMSMYELLDLWLVLEAAVELATENQYSGLLDE